MHSSSQFLNSFDLSFTPSCNSHFLLSAPPFLFGPSFHLPSLTLIFLSPALSSSLSCPSCKWFIFMHWKWIAPPFTTFVFFIFLPCIIILSVNLIAVSVRIFFTFLIYTSFFFVVRSSFGCLIFFLNSYPLFLLLHFLLPVSFHQLRNIKFQSLIFILLHLRPLFTFLVNCKCSITLYTVATSAKIGRWIYIPMDLTINNIQLCVIVYG